MRSYFILIIMFITLNANMFDLNETNTSRERARENIVISSTLTDVNKSVTEVNISSSAGKEKIKNPVIWEKFFSNQTHYNYRTGTSNLNSALNTGATKKMYNKAQTLSIDKLTTSDLSINPDFNNSKVISGISEFSEARSDIFADTVRVLGNDPSDATHNVIKRCSITRAISSILGYQCNYPDGSSGATYFNPELSLQQQAKACKSECKQAKRCLEKREGSYENIYLLPFIAEKNSTIVKNFYIDSNIVDLSIPLKNLPKHSGKAFLSVKFETNGLEEGYFYNNVDLFLFVDRNDTTPYEANVTYTNRVKDKEIHKLIITVINNSESNITFDKIEAKIETESPLYQCEIESIYNSDRKDGYFTSKYKCESECYSRGICKLRFDTVPVLDDYRIRNKCAEVVSDYDSCVLKDEFIDFSGRGELTQSVSNFRIVPDVVRPRISASVDDNYTKMIIAETKDNAYRNMQEQQTYDIVENPFSSDTNVTYAYRTIPRTDDTNTTVVNLYGNSLMGLDLLIKPRRFDVRSGNRFRVFGVLEVQVAYRDNATRTYIRDKIYYILKNSHQAIPFKRIYRYGKLSKVEYTPHYGEVIPETDINTSSLTVIPLSTSRTYWQTFNWDTNDTGHWSDVSSGADITDKYLWEGKFDSNNYNWVFEFIRTFSDFLNVNSDEAAINLPGIYRYVDNATLTKHYKGRYNNTGQAIVKLIAYAYYQKATDSLNYRELLEKATPFWESGNELVYPTKTKDDSKTQKDGIKIYINGKSEDSSIYTIIHPRSEFIGKPGFIFVFFGN